MFPYNDFIINVEIKNLDYGLIIIICLRTVIKYSDQILIIYKAPTVRSPTTCHENYTS